MTFFDTHYIYLKLVWFIFWVSTKITGNDECIRTPSVVEADGVPIPQQPLCLELRESEKLSFLGWEVWIWMEFWPQRKDLLLLDTIKNSIDAKNLSWNSVRVIFSTKSCGRCQKIEVLHTAPQCILASRNSITHNATVMAHGLMQCGTTSDVFLRPDLRVKSWELVICVLSRWKRGKNLEWLAKASNWAKFSATASLGLILCVSMGKFLCEKTMQNSGVIHKGHIKESRHWDVMELWANCVYYSFSEFDRLVVAVGTGQSWAPICLNKEAVCFVSSSLKRVESVEWRVAEPTKMRRYFWILLLFAEGTRGSPYSEGGALYGMGQGLEFQYLIVPFTSNVSRPRPDSCESLRSGYQGLGCCQVSRRSTKQPWEQMTDNLWGLPFGTATQRSGNWGFEDMIIETVSGLHVDIDTVYCYVLFIL